MCCRRRRRSILIVGSTWPNWVTSHSTTNHPLLAECLVNIPSLLLTVYVTGPTIGRLCERWLTMPRPRFTNPVARVLDEGFACLSV
jgi:hypothetical protein